MFAAKKCRKRSEARSPAAAIGCIPRLLVRLFWGQHERDQRVADRCLQQDAAAGRNHHELLRRWLRDGGELRAALAPCKGLVPCFLVDARDRSVTSYLTI